MIENIKGAIFDMDGTLIDSLMIWDVIWKKFGEKFTEKGTFLPTPDEEKAIRTMTLKDAMNFLYSKHKIADSGEELLSVANDTIMEFYKKEVKLKEGVLEFLEYLRRKNVKMCIASATDTALLDVAIKHCGIEKYFEGFISCAEIGKGKEEPDVYLKALQSLGTDMADTWVFEDSFVAIETACKMGIKTVGIYDKYNPNQDKIKKTATYYIADGENLTKLIG